MSADINPRVRAPQKAKPGEIIEIRTLVSHRMETGQRVDASGARIPRHILNRFTASFNGKTVFTADWRPAVSANPYQSFYFRARESGEFRFVWRDDAGVEFTATAKLEVG